MTGIIIHINGWPGAGKYTVGRLAAERLGASLIPNHVINGPGFALSCFGTPTFRRIVPRVRALVYEEIVAAASSERFILTTVLIDDPEDAALFAKIEALAAHRNCPFLAVTLHCALEQNAARLDSEARALRYSRIDRDVLRDLRDVHALLEPACDHHLVLDVTSAKPSKSAARIVEAAQDLLADKRGRT